MPAKKAPKKTPSAPTSRAQKATAKSIVPKKPTAAKQPATKFAAPKPARGFYVSFTGVSTKISTEKPKGIKSPPAFDTFDQAKAAAVDGLVEAIEAAEAQLLVLKRATSPANLGG